MAWYNPFTSIHSNLVHGLAILTESFSPLRSVLHNLLLKSKAEVCTKLRDSLLYHVHLNWIKLVLSSFSQFQPTRVTGVKC